MSRHLSDYISAYLKYTENSEPAKSYHLWCCLGMLAGAVQRKVYMKWAGQNIFPNLYIILVGPAGRARKGTALGFAKRLLETTDTVVMSGAITPEALMQRMGHANQTYTDQSDGKTRFHCSTTFLSDELSVFMGQKNIRLLASLCDWYDCPDQWKNDTKNVGTDAINGMYFNMVGGTAPEWLKSMLPGEAIGGGFSSRVIWVVEEDKGKTVVIPTIDLELEKYLIRDLESIHLTNGEMKFDKDALALYADWYTKQDQMIAQGVFPIQDPKFSAYCDRRGTLIKKVCMLVAVSERVKFNKEDSCYYITADNFERALSILELTEKKMSNAFTGLGESRYIQATEQLQAFIIRHKKVTQQQILKYLYRDIDLHTLDVASRMLEKMGAIKVRRTEEGVWWYEKIDSFSDS